MQAWFAGDFGRCLELCDAVRVRDASAHVHVCLLRARALLRLQRSAEALEVLRGTPPAPLDSDEAITTRMLTGEARLRCGEAAAGLQALLEAQRSAEAFGAHPTIVSEISMNLGLAYYCAHDFATADAMLRTIDESADLVYARAVQFRAWIASARGLEAEAVTLFIRALTSLDRCRHRDRYFEANCTRALAHLALERLDRRTWAYVADRRARIDPSSPALPEAHFFIAYCAAAFELEVQGDPLEAAREARLAEDLAPTGAFRVQGRCRRAWVARTRGEPLAHRDHADSAAELFATIDTASLSGDEHVVPLVLAEELVAIRPARARELIHLFDGLPPMSPMRLLAQSSMLEIYRALVDGLVFEANGDRERAVENYRRVFGVYRQRGYTRRAVMVAERLWALTRDRKAYAYMVDETKHLPPTSYLKRKVDAARHNAVRLTSVQCEVLALICQGKSNPEIARLRKRSLHTVRNLVARLFEVFEVSSREELAVECVRRGLYTPK